MLAAGSVLGLPSLPSTIRPQNWGKLEGAVRLDVGDLDPGIMGSTPTVVVGRLFGVTFGASNFE